MELTVPRPNTLQNNGENPKVLESVAGALGIALAQELVKFGVNKVSTFVSDQAEDDTKTYTSHARSNLYYLKKTEKSDSDSDIYQGLLNKDLTCVTMVTSVKRLAVTGQPAEERPKEWEPDNWNAAGPPFKQVKARLKEGGFEFDSESNPSIIFEGRWILSRDGRGFYFKPLFASFLTFPDDGVAKYVDRGVGMILSLGVPTEEGETQILTSSIDLGTVETDKEDGATIRGVSGHRFGPETLAEILPTPKWAHVALSDTSIPDPIVDKVKTDEGGKERDPIPYRPVNVNASTVITEEGSEVAAFLSDFFEKSEVEEQVSNAIIDEFDIKSQAEKDSETVDSLTDRISVLKTHRDAYKDEHSNKRPEDYDDNLDTYNTLIDKLTLEKTVLESGCDETGIRTEAACE